jgi:hypothetical protein
MFRHTDASPLETLMEGDASGSSWRFAQCFGDKGEVDDITEGDYIVFPLELYDKHLVH